MKININSKTTNLSVSDVLDIIRIYSITDSKIIKFKGFNYITYCNTEDKEVTFTIKQEIIDMNIIKDNRIVNDTTFATRLKSFLKNIKVNDAMGEKGLEYLQRVADGLVLHQANTATDKGEKEYLNGCHKMNLI
jgi:hypothetical protein